MKKLVLLSFPLVLGGCSLLPGSPVPPLPPTAPEIGQATGRTSVYVGNEFNRNNRGGIINFKALQAAEVLVADAEKSPEVARVSAKELAQAQSSLKKAQADWQKIKANPLSDRGALAILAHHSYMAKRWAQVALAEAGVDTGLDNLANAQQKLNRIDAKRQQLASQDARWLGQSVVPDEFGRISFAVGTAQLTHNSQAVVQQLAGFLNEHPRYGLEIDGYTDNSPPSPANLDKFVADRADLAGEGPTAQARAYNLDMSRRRAAALAGALAAQGISKQRLKVQGYGQSKPIADNNTAAGRSKNRRVTATVTKLPAAAGEKTGQSS